MNTELEKELPKIKQDIERIEISCYVEILSQNLNGPVPTLKREVKPLKLQLSKQDQVHQQKEDKYAKRLFNL